MLADSLCLETGFFEKAATNMPAVTLLNALEYRQKGGQSQKTYA
jgi:hypothetical protein